MKILKTLIKISAVLFIASPSLALMPQQELLPSDELFFKGGEWPLPVRVAPFPIRDVVGTWDLGAEKPVMEIREPRQYPGGVVVVDVQLRDRVTGTVISKGPGKVVKNILTADNLRINDTVIYIQMQSLVPPKNSIEAQRNEKMIYLYVLDKLDRSRSATFRVKKIR